MAKEKRVKEEVKEEVTIKMEKINGEERTVTRNKKGEIIENRAA